MSLVEMLVAMFLLSVVLTMAIMVLNALFRLEGGVKGHAEATAATARLGRTFRRDARRAVAVIEPAPEGAVVGLRLGEGHEVVYRVRSGMPERIETGPGGWRRWERFRVPARGFSVVADGRLLRMRFDRRRAGGPERSARLIEIAAIRGADWRFTTSGEGPR